MRFYMKKFHTRFTMINCTANKHKFNKAQNNYFLKKSTINNS